MACDEKTPLLLEDGSEFYQAERFENNNPPPIESKSDRNKRYQSIAIALAGIFILYIQTSIYWTSLYPYLSQIDPTATATFFGLIIASYNLGSALASPILGYYSNCIREIRRPVVVGVCINIVGNIFTAFVEIFPYHRKWVLLTSRFITGIGAGAVGTLSAYNAMASHLHERNTACAFQAAMLSLAVLGGPGLQAAFVFVGYPGFQWKEFRFNMYTAPVYTVVIFDFILIFFLYTFFKEYHVAVHQDADLEPRKLKPLDPVAAFTCIWCRFVILFCVVTMTMFRWTRSEAILYNGIIQTAAGTIDFIGNMIVGNFVLRFIKERCLMLVGVASFLMFYVFSFSYPGLPPLLSDDELVQFQLRNHTDTDSLWPDAIGGNESQIDSGLCSYEWCPYTTRIYFWQYILAFVSLTLAFSLAFSPTATLFSKVLGPRRQGFMQGVNDGCGRAAMMLSPIMTSALFQHYGPRVAWSVAASLLVGTLVLITVTFGRLKPYKG